MLKIIEEKNNKNFIIELNSRNTQDYKKITKSVEAIIEDVKNNGNRALAKYAKKYDGFEEDNFEVKDYEIEKAVKEIDRKLYKTIEKAYNNIKDYHKKQKRRTNTYKPENKDIILGQIIKPIKKAGIYIPGGKAAYPSTVLMNAVPAKIAGVEEISMITPVGKEGKISPSILVAAYICGVDKIYKVGGA